MADNRLVKVALPAKLVTEMDKAVTNSSAYAGRTEFMTDAVANLLADLKTSEVSADAKVGEWVQVSPERVSEVEERATSQLQPDSQVPRGPRVSRDEAVDLATLRAPNDTVPTLTVDLARHRPSTEPTWGMHNRDWPTVWAASILGRISIRGPVKYTKFTEELISSAWSVASALRDDWDLSGFPTSGTKAARSEARFIEFFVGREHGDGPLFSFGLAVPSGSDEVVLTNSGASLLKELSGMTRKNGVGPSPGCRQAFLRHLALFAPADVAMLREVVRHIVNGDSTRLELIGAIEREHPDWPKGTSATNAAGYVARAREWGLVAPKQLNHQYVVEPDAAVDLERIRTPELRGDQ